MNDTERIVEVLRGVPGIRPRIFDLAEALRVPETGEFDLDGAVMREHELALAQAEAEFYVKATQRAREGLQRLPARPG
jgi:hypothetical protein